MNEKIVDILRISDAPDKLYAAQYIEDLHAENERLREALREIYCVPNIANDVDWVQMMMDLAFEALNEVTP